MFTVVTQPVQGHGLCGEITLTPKYDGTSLPSTDLLTQVAYNGNDREFSIISINGDLIGGSKPYSVVATFTSYDPSVFTGAPTAQASGIINFNDPCVQPFDLTPRVTASPTSDNFSGQPITVQVLEFQVSPARCSVTYTCSEITRKDGSASNISCTDVTYDGDFDGNGNDGELVITASESDYTSGKITPGTYVIEITGTVDGSSGPASDKTTVEVTFTDPCDAPRLITAPTLVDQQYILTN